MQNMHRQYIINKFLQNGGVLDICQINVSDITQLMLMISNINDDHEVRSENIKLPIYMQAGVFILRTANCWNDCGRLSVAADHPTYCDSCHQAADMMETAESMLG